MYRLFIFDFDGTLVDTAPDIVYYTNVVLKEFGYPEKSFDEVRKAVGKGVHELLRSLGFQEDPETLDKAVCLLKERYLESPVRTTSVYPHVREMLSGPLRGAKKAVVTNKLQTLTEKILNQLSMRDHFDLVIGDGGGFPCKPDPASVRHVLETLQVQPFEALFIGDSEVDFKTAGNAGVDFIFMEYGYDKFFKEENVKRFFSASEWGRLASLNGRVR